MQILIRLHTELEVVWYTGAAGMLYTVHKGGPCQSVYVFPF